MAFSPQVSVIIPVYNRELTIGRAIESVLSQSFRDFELIIVDDGSTDRTREVIGSYHDSRIILHTNNENSGTSYTRNTGIKLAKGEYISFLDSDDEWFEEKLSQQMDTLIKSGDHVGACVCGNYIRKGKGDIFHLPRSYGSWYKRLVTVCEFFPGSTLLIKKFSFDKVGLFDEELIRYEDWDWLVRFTKYYDIITIERPLARVYQSTYQNYETEAQAGIKLLEKHEEEIHNFGLLKAQRIKSRRYHDIAWHYYLAASSTNKEMDNKKIRKYYMKTILAFPFQKPGVYLAWIDSILGTSLRVWFAKNIWSHLLSEEVEIR